MARIHVLQAAGVDTYTVVVHAPTPAGNNSAGIAWSTALANAGLATTVMTVGNGPGQISQSEANQIAAGTVLEGTMQWGDNPAWTNAERQADLALRANQLIAELQARYAAQLKFFGATVA